MPSSTTLLQRISTSSDHHHHTKHHHHHHTKHQHHPLTTLPHSLTQQLHTLSPSDYTIIITHHTHNLNPNQATSTIIHHISAPLSTVWSIIRQFDNPLPYKHFLKSCHLILGDSNSIGSLREVRVISGLPAESSTERLEILDDERHVISFSVVGGQHRLRNYRSVTTLHRVEEENGSESTMVVESYVVDVPIGNTKEDTTAFADTIVKCNLQALAQITEKKLIAD